MNKSAYRNVFVYLNSAIGPPRGRHPREVGVQRKSGSEGKKSKGIHLLFGDSVNPASYRLDSLGLLLQSVIPLAQKNSNMLG